MCLSEITFFEQFESDILSGKKTITIRNEAEKDYQPGAVVQVSTYEDGRWFCALKIESVEPVTFDELTDYHAAQENMTLKELKGVISAIYPNTSELFVIKYRLVKQA